VESGYHLARWWTANRRKRLRKKVVFYRGTSITIARRGKLPRGQSDHRPRSREKEGAPGDAFLASSHPRGGEKINEGGVREKKANLENEVIGRRGAPSLAGQNPESFSHYLRLASKGFELRSRRRRSGKSKSNSVQRRVTQGSGQGAGQVTQPGRGGRRGARREKRNSWTAEKRSPKKPLHREKNRASKNGATSKHGALVGQKGARGGQSEINFQGTEDAKFPLQRLGNELSLWDLIRGAGRGREGGGGEWADLSVRTWRGTSLRGGVLRSRARRKKCEQGAKRRSVRRKSESRERYRPEPPQKKTLLV